jgi:type II secretory pathway component PulM
MASYQLRSSPIKKSANSKGIVSSQAVSSTTTSIRPKMKSRKEQEEERLQKYEQLQSIMAKAKEEMRTLKKSASTRKDQSSGN